MGHIKGVNLSHFHEKKWLRQALLNLVKIIITLISLLSMASMIQIFASQKKQEVQRLTNHKYEIEMKLREIENKTEQLNQQQAVDLSQIFTKKQIQTFNQLIRQIPIKTGGIEAIRFYFDGSEKIKIVGKYEKQTDFESLERYFKERNFKPTIEYLQSNGKIKSDFSLILEKE